MAGAYVRTVCEIAPNAVYTRNSEGDFVRLADGRLLFAYTRYLDQYSDDAASSIVAMVSDDEGETWSEAWEVLNAAEFGVHNVMSVSLLPLNNGDTGMFYIVKHAAHTRIMLSRSSDGGRTFGAHCECTLPDRRGWYVLNNSRVIRLRSGRLIVPLAYHRAGLDAATGNRFIDPCACACMLYSDDDGVSWAEAPDVLHPPFTGTRSGLQEPGVIELNDGTIWAYFRTDMQCQYEAFSRDMGLHWTVPQPSRFTSPLSPMKVVRRPDNGALYAIWNPVPNWSGRAQHCDGAWLGGRTPLVYALSRDDGRTWSEPVEIAGDPRRGYCYPAACFTRDGAMLLVYCSGGVADGICLARLTISKIALE